MVDFGLFDSKCAENDQTNAIWHIVAEQKKEIAKLKSELRDLKLYAKLGRAVFNYIDDSHETAEFFGYGDDCDSALDVKNEIVKLQEEGKT